MASVQDGAVKLVSVRRRRGRPRYGRCMSRNQDGDAIESGAVKSRQDADFHRIRRFAGGGVESIFSFVRIALGILSFPVYYNMQIDLMQRFRELLYKQVKEGSHFCHSQSPPNHMADIWKWLLVSG